jgi:hypothetical protein
MTRQPILLLNRGRDKVSYRESIDRYQADQVDAKTGDASAESTAEVTEGEEGLADGTVSTNPAKSDEEPSAASAEDAVALTKEASASADPATIAPEAQSSTTIEESPAENVPEKEVQAESEVTGAPDVDPNPDEENTIPADIRQPLEDPSLPTQVDEDATEGQAQSQPIGGEAAIYEPAGDEDDDLIEGGEEYEEGDYDEEEGDDVEEGDDQDPYGIDGFVNGVDGEEADELVEGGDSAEGLVEGEELEEYDGEAEGDEGELVHLSLIGIKLITVYDAEAGAEAEELAPDASVDPETNGHTAHDDVTGEGVEAEGVLSPIKRGRSADLEEGEEAAGKRVKMGGE